MRRDNRTEGQDWRAVPARYYAPTCNHRCGNFPVMPALIDPEPAGYETDRAPYGVVSYGLDEFPTVEAKTLYSH